MVDYGLWQKNEEEIKEGFEGMKIPNRSFG
jgi:hypothetical protein